MLRSHVKHWINLLFAGHTSRKIEILAGEIARQCRTGFTDRVFSKSKTLPPEQLRGYIMAHAVGCLEAIANQQREIQQLNRSQFSKVILLAREFLIEMVIRDIQAIPPTVVGDIATAA